MIEFTKKTKEELEALTPERLKAMLVSKTHTKVGE